MRRTLLLASFALLACLAQPARAQFCPGASPWVFDDVPVGDPFCGYITWAAQNGITLGCAIIDANHRLYCPGDPVRRDQMAAFVNRLGNVRVEAVGTGQGLTGGPITGIGTINLAATNLLPTVACANNQIARWNGSAWVCSTDANSGGTVTSVGSGTGLAGGPITTSGMLSIAMGYQLPQGCTNGQVAKSSGSNLWTCANDVNSGGTVTSITAGNGLTGGTITTAGTIAVDPASTTLTNNFFRQNGNAFGVTAVLGTTDNNALDIRVNGARVMRYEPNAISPNVIGGSPANIVTAGVRGATIGGGGVPSGLGSEAPNRVTDHYGTVAGGYANVAGSDDASLTNGAWAAIGGGLRNVASGQGSTISGGFVNVASGQFATLSGGQSNSAAATSSVVGGGIRNTASGPTSAVGGGDTNTASGSSSTVGGGAGNAAAGSYSTVGGGTENVASGDYSFAVGRRALTQTAGGTPVPHDGTFAFADAQNFDFHTTVDNEFAVRATGGARFVTAIDGTGNPTRTVKINANGELDFGSQERQMLNLWGPATYGIGVQAFTLYSRSDGAFAWFVDGVHSNTTYDPGAGGSVLATLQAGASTTTVTGTFRAQAFTATSDRAAKTEFRSVDGADMLAKVVSMPIASWSYVNEHASGVRHIGPTAQDFHARFGVGYDDKTIATVDADGVALAAIQGLNAKLEAKVAEQTREIESLKSSHATQIAELKRAVEVLLARTSPEGRIASK